MAVIIHVGHASVRGAERLAAHAEEIGADGVASVSPFYFKPASLESLVDCVAEIARGAPRLPFYYYHIPVMTGVGFSMPEFLPLAQARIPNFAGIKFTSTAVHEFQACGRARARDAQLFFGVDEMLLSGLVAGATGAIGSTYNFAAPLYRRLWTAFHRGDLESAREDQARSVEMIRVLTRRRFLAASKGVLRLLGIDCGPTRLPIVPLSSAELTGLEEELRSIGFFTWAR
jgi:N-acetylneuraminate lyase